MHVIVLGTTVLFTNRRHSAQWTSELNTFIYQLTGQVTEHHLLLEAFILPLAAISGNPPDF